VIVKQKVTDSCDGEAGDVSVDEAGRNTSVSEVETSDSDSDTGGWK
jgi:hypothetical protein